MSDKYILVNKTPVPCNDLIEWAEWFESTDRIVKKTTVGELKVSTIFLGFDHGFTGKGPPLIFQTTIFDEDGGVINMDLHSKWDEAVKGHDFFVKKYKERAN